AHPFGGKAVSDVNYNSRPGHPKGLERTALFWDGRGGGWRQRKTLSCHWVGCVSSAWRTISGVRMDKEATSPPHTAPRLGAVIEVSGIHVSCELLGDMPDSAGSYNQVQIGDVIRIPTPTTVAFGFVDHVTFESAPSGRGPARAEIDLLGELKPVPGRKDPVF